MRRTVLYEHRAARVLQDTPTGHILIEKPDSVAVLVRCADGRFVFIEQSRPAMIREDNPSGLNFEVVAGRFDRSLTVQQLVVAELQEEIGATIEEDQVFLLNAREPLAVSPGYSTERQYLAFVRLLPGQLEEADRVYGLAHEGESITRRFVDPRDLSIMHFEDLKTFALVQWYLVNYCNN